MWYGNGPRTHIEAATRARNRSGFGRYARSGSAVALGQRNRLQRLRHALHAAEQNRSMALWSCLFLSVPVFALPVVLMLVDTGRSPLLGLIAYPFALPPVVAVLLISRRLQRLRTQLRELTPEPINGPSG